MDLATLWLEASVILVLIALNGFFSAAEIAVVTLRRSRIGQLVEEGWGGARIVDSLKEDPSNFLATVQVGVTVVASMASVIGGAGAVALLQPALEALPLPFMQTAAGPIALVLTVAVISYLTLVFGELVPKSLALHYTEGLALFSGPLVHRMSRVLAPAIAILHWSTSMVLRLFGREGSPAEILFSEDEVKRIVSEGADQGIFDQAEQQLIRSVFEFTDTPVRAVMVPRSDIHGVELTNSVDEVVQGLLDTGFSRAPVYDQNLEHIVGIVHIKDLLKHTSRDSHVNLSSVMHPPHFVPDSMQISDLLRDQQSRRIHMAIVLNEFGTVIGLATIEDLLEEIVGEIRDEFDTDEELPIQQLPDGALLVEGSVTLDNLKEEYGLPLKETQAYRNIAGFVLAHLGRIPKGGETFRHEDLRITIVTVDDRRLRKVRIEQVGTTRTEPPSS